MTYRMKRTLRGVSLSLLIVSVLFLLPLLTSGPSSPEWIRAVTGVHGKAKNGPEYKGGAGSSGSETSIADHIVISEIYYNPEDESDSEFVEFYNPTASSVDVSGWDFSDDGGESWVNFADDTDSQANLVVPSGGFLLLADGGWGESKDSSSWPSPDVTDEISLTNSGGTVKVRSSSGSVVDSVSYAGDAGNGQGVERKADPSSTKESMRGSDSDQGNGYDTDSFSDDFVGPLAGDPQNTDSPPETYGSSSNENPTADPGGPYECSVGETIQLDGSASSDPDGSIVSYAWEFTGDHNYDDGAGVTLSYTPQSAGTVVVSLKVTDDEGATGEASTEVIVNPETLDISANHHSLPADGSSETTITVGYGVEVTSVSFTAQRGELSQSTAVIGADHTAQVTLTAPATPGPTTIRAEADGQVAATAVFFRATDSPEVAATRTEVIGQGVSSVTVDGKDGMGGLVEATKEEGSDKAVALTLARYAGNPAAEAGLDVSSGGYFDVYVDRPGELSQLTFRIYLVPWPGTPSALYWDSSAGQWATPSDLSPNQDGGYVEVVLNSGTEPVLTDLSGLQFAAGADSGGSQDLVTREITVTEPGWHMVEIPLSPEDDSPAATFEGVEPSAVSHWDPAKDGGKGGYITPGEGYRLRIHRGNWIHLEETEVPKTFTVTGTTVEEGEIFLSEPGWHQIGIPGDSSPADLGVREKKDGKVIAMDRAINELDLLSRFIWEWDPVKETYFAYQIGTSDKGFQPGVSYWVLTEQPGVRLVYPFPSPPERPSTGEILHSNGFRSPSSSPRGETIPSPPYPPEFSPEAGFSVYATPNPVRTENRVSFQATGADVRSLRVRVYNLNGERIYASEWTEGRVASWGLTGKGSEGVPNGLYIYRVVARKGDGRRVSSIGKLVVLT